MANRFQSNRQKSVESLPQRNEHWHVLVHHLRVWVAPPDEAPSRPWLVLVLNVQNGLIQFSEVLTAEPDSKTLLTILQHSMQRTEKQLRITPHRPSLISLEAAGMAEALRTSLARMGINSTVLDRPTGVADLLSDLEDHMRGAPEIPGLLAGRGVTEPLVASFYAAAVRFYQAAPWSDLTDRHPLRITVGKTTRVAVVMGAGGVEYGLAIYNKWRDFERILTGADQLLAIIPSGGMKALNYVPITEVPFPDLEAIEAHNWPLPEEGIYAVPLVITRDGEAKRPLRAELEWYESALLAIPYFVENNLQLDDNGEFLPVAATIDVSSQRGSATVEITYPAGELPERFNQPTDLGRPFDESGEFPFLDRRAMEATLFGFGESNQSASLQAAQEQIYQAWEEPQPKRRIALARKALKLSADCADAYVLLAEEAAKTLGEALTYYEQGVAAGERAIGAEFHALVGHFWGILETRPYMRARQGLANVLSELGRTAEAIDHYRELLRLNPGDNQGIRYSLLNLLLARDDLDAVHKLLREYDEGSAEWLYTSALVAFREQGANRKTDALLREAIKVNVHVPAYLTARKRLPLQLPAFVGMGDESEAVTYAAAYLAHWRKTEGAIAWLQRLTKKT